MHLFLFSIHSCYIPCPSNPRRLVHFNYAWRRKSTMHVMTCSSLVYCFLVFTEMCVFRMMSWLLVFLSPVRTDWTLGAESESCYNITADLYSRVNVRTGCNPETAICRLLVEINCSSREREREREKSLAGESTNRLSGGLATIYAAHLRGWTVTYLLNTIPLVPIGTRASSEASPSFSLNLSPCIPHRTEIKLWYFSCRYLWGQLGRMVDIRWHIR
jgi:hypothetical protein